MLVIESRVDVAGLTGRDVTDFMVACTDEQYQRWWPGTHLRLHVLGRATGGVGDVVVMDEFIGRRRVRLRGVVEAVEPGRSLVWRFRKIVPLPGRLSLEFSPVPGGVSVRHTITAGWPGIGRCWTRCCGCTSRPGSLRTLMPTCTRNSHCCGTISGLTQRPAPRTDSQPHPAADSARKRSKRTLG